MSKPDDYENVSITQVEGEVKGLFKIGEVSAKAKGTTEFSNQERVKERAYRKLKMQAAIMGANIVYLTHQRTEGNKYGGYYQASSSAETNLSGIAYTNCLPSFEDFQKIIQSKRDFNAIEKNSLWSSGSSFSTVKMNKKLVINELKTENGMIIIDATLEGLKKYSTFRVVAFDNDYFHIFYEDKSTVYNIKIEIN